MKVAPYLVPGNESRTLAQKEQLLREAKVSITTALTPIHLVTTRAAAGQKQSSFHAVLCPDFDFAFDEIALPVVANSRTLNPRALLTRSRRCAKHQR